MCSALLCAAVLLTMIAIATPGKWPVFCFICSVTSWRSNSVLPHDGQDTKSVLTDLILLPGSVWKGSVRIGVRSLTSLGIMCYDCNVYMKRCWWLVAGDTAANMIVYLQPHVCKTTPETTRLGKASQGKTR